MIENDDRYTLPIHILIDAYNPLDIARLKEILDDRGYYGRYKIIEIKDYKLNATKLKIEVYMPDSCITYSWPYENFYILGKGLAKKRLKNKIGSYCAKLLQYVQYTDYFKYDRPTSNKGSLEGHLKWAYSNLGIDPSKKNKVLDTLEWHGIVKRNDIIFKSAEDIDEYCYNILGF